MQYKPRQTDCPHCGGTGKLYVYESLGAHLHRLRCEKDVAELSCTRICNDTLNTEAERRVARAARDKAVEAFHIVNDVYRERGE